MKKVIIYTDGSTRKNPGPGGWACILKYGQKEKVVTGGTLEETTNNRTEITALIEGLSALKEPCKVEFYSDSKYLINGCNEWLSIWQQRRWKKSNRTPVENRDLWEKIVELKQKHNVVGYWIRGHNGHPENERCDELAKNAIP